MRILYIISILVSMGLFCCKEASKQETTQDAQSVYLSPGVMCGTVTLTDGCGPEVDTMIRFGLALLHHMTYEDAEYNFSQVIAKDPDCFWGHWGQAMSYVHPLWSDPAYEERFEKGKLHADRAVALAQTDQQRLYGNAIAAYYADPELSEPDRLKAFHAGWVQASEALPEDIEARLFYGLSKLAITPHTDKSYATQLEVGALAEDVLKVVPDHPGAFHYAIHAYDIPALADKALFVASNYGKVAPEIPHALHMPSHIFTRLGYWQESIDWNQRSAKVAKAYNAQGNRSMHYFHALDYIVYAALQQGDDALAQEIQQTLDTLTGPYQVTAATAYALAAIPARLALENHRWEDASKLTPPHPDLVDWDKFPAFKTITYFARGIGAARSDQFGIAEDALVTLDTLISQVSQSKSLAYWAEQARIQRATVQAWLSYASGDEKTGLAQMREAVELEAKTEKHPVSPGEIIPVAELYGDMLLESGHAAEALVQYQSALARTPNRYNGLYGAGLAAERAGQEAAMQTYYGELVKVAKAERTKRETFQHAQASLKEM